MNPKKQSVKTILSWNTALYTEYERGVLWYVIASLISVATIILSLFFGSKTFSFVIFIISIAYILTAGKEVPHVKAIITLDGIQFGNQKHLFDDIEYFWIEQHLPNFQSLHLVKPKSKVKDIEIQFYEVSEAEMINTLQRFIPYNPEQKPGLVDHLIHILKL
jgi:hypothetical protein